MVGSESRSVIIESSNGYFLNGVQTGKFILTSGTIFCFPEFDSVLHDISLNFNTKSDLINIEELVSMFNKNFDKCASSNSLKLSENEILEVNSIFFSRIVYQTLNGNSFYRFFDTTKVKEDFDITPNVVLQLCSTFVILKVRDNFEEIRDDLNSAYYFLRSTSSTQLSQGMDVVVEYSPFVNSSFLNSWSTGIVSQVFGEDSCIFVTDVHLPLHGGGAPVYRFRNGYKDSLLGIIIEPKMWNNNVWSGNSLAVNLNAVLKHYLVSVDSMLDNNYFLTYKESTGATWFDELGCSVVRIEMENLWGSGVVLNSELGVIMTCAHVVNYKTGCDVVVKCGGLSSLGKVVYSSKLGEVYDLAVIVTKFQLDCLKQLEISKDFPIKGETVYSAGFNWPNTSKLIVSKGVVSRVVIGNTMPIMVTTSCCIQPGCSGGALLQSNGQLIGIPVMSLSHTSDHLPHSHYNCAVPLCLIRDVIDEFCQTSDISLLGCLTTTETGTLRKWKMKNKL